MVGVKLPNLIRYEKVMEVTNGLKDGAGIIWGGGGYIRRGNI